MFVGWQLRDEVDACANVIAVGLGGVAGGWSVRQGCGFGDHVVVPYSSSLCFQVRSGQPDYSLFAAGAVSKFSSSTNQTGLRFVLPHNA